MTSDRDKVLGCFHEATRRVEQQEIKTILSIRTLELATGLPVSTLAPLLDLLVEEGLLCKWDMPEMGESPAQAGWSLPADEAGKGASDEAVLLERVLAEVQRIQAMAPACMPVWFKAGVIVDALGIERERVNEALLRLCDRDDVVSALMFEGGVVSLVYALGEVFEIRPLSPEAE